MAKVSALMSTLMRSVTSIDSARASRLAGVGIRASQKYLEDLKGERDNMLEKLSELEDMSSKTDANAGVKALSNDDLAKRIVKIHEAELALELMNKKIEIAERTHAKFAAETEDATEVAPATK